MKTCSKCRVDLKKVDSGTDTRDGIVCDDCIGQYGVCDSCTDCVDKDDLNNIDNPRITRDICERCLRDNYRSCDNCSMILPNSLFTDRNVCDNCYSEDDEEVDSRSMGIVSAKFEKGKILKNDRGFGVEIECYYPENKNLKAIAIDKRFKEVGICGDGSIHAEGQEGVEFQMPVLRGKNGEDYIKEFCAALKDNEFGVNDSCGLHVHLSGKGHFTEASRLAALIMFYIVFDNVILSFLPKSRRMNQYCEPISKRFSVNNVRDCLNRCRTNEEAVHKLEAMWYSVSPHQTEWRSIIKASKSDRKHHTRRCGVNLHTLISDDHLEIRYHSGTINAKKILFWVELHMAIMDSCAYHPDLDDIINLQQSLSIAEKTQILFKRLNLSEQAQKYLIERQEKFTGISSLEKMMKKSDTLSTLTEEILCVE